MERKLQSKYVNIRQFQDLKFRILKIGENEEHEGSGGESSTKCK